MKQRLLAVLTLVAGLGLLITSCDLLGLGPKGLVTYYDGLPGYAAGEITFRAEIQAPGVAVTSVQIEWEIRHGDSVVESGVAEADEDISGVGYSLVSDVVTVDTNDLGLSGKTITIHLDPDDKVTSAEYTSAVYVNLYKVATISIP